VDLAGRLLGPVLLTGKGQTFGFLGPLGTSTYTQTCAGFSPREATPPTLTQLG
jgi:hypothetical protein